MISYSSPDLTQHPPRSPRVRLGGYAILPRCLDKCRAALAGKIGEYHYACPLDQRFLTFAGIDPDALKDQVSKGLSDWAILIWIQSNAKNKHAPWEISAWSSYQDTQTIASSQMRSRFNALVADAKADNRDDIVGWFDLLDADDYATFGGKP
jgi:hypothetical protein